MLCLNCFSFFLFCVMFILFCNLVRGLKILMMKFLWSKLWLIDGFTCLKYGLIEDIQRYTLVGRKMYKLIVWSCIYIFPSRILALHCYWCMFISCYLDDPFCLYFILPITMTNFVVCFHMNVFISLVHCAKEILINNFRMTSKEPTYYIARQEASS